MPEDRVFYVRGATPELGYKAVEHDLPLLRSSALPTAVVRIATGILPPRNDDLERIPVWLDGLLADQPAHHGRLIRPFTTWVLLRRARRQAAGRLHTASAAQHVRRRVRQALHLLDWLDAHHIDLAALDQNRCPSCPAGPATAGHVRSRRPVLAFPESSITITPPPCGAVAEPARSSSSRRSLTCSTSMGDSDRKNCGRCTPGIPAPATGSAPRQADDRLVPLPRRRQPRQVLAKPSPLAKPKKRSSNPAAYSSNGPGAGGHGRRAVIFSPRQGS
ncbi:hypothetical protein ACIPX0_47360 [Streptomyces sp. NPDC090075]|uniref:hypothetical protein n=1 Tax=Streptomyces sp. NPDC090075 TaxID=3365937 RepID=UPI0037F798BA